jgi:hypothetical protein
MGDHIWLQEGPADGDALKFGGPAASRQPGLGGIPDVDEHWNWPGDGSTRLVRTCEPGEGEDRCREDRSTQAQPVRQALKPHLSEAELGGALQALGVALRLQCPSGQGGVVLVAARIELPAAEMHGLAPAQLLVRVQNRDELAIELVDRLVSPEEISPPLQQALYELVGDGLEAYLQGGSSRFQFSGRKVPHRHPGGGQDPDGGGDQGESEQERHKC